MEILQKLISINSVTGNEKGIQKFIYRYIKSLKLEPIRVGENVSVLIKGENRKVALIFNSHVDTVTPGSLELWRNNPFSGVISKGKIYGLGASDEKVSVAVSLEMAKYYSEHKPECDIWLSFVVREEVDGSGTKEFLKWFGNEYLSKYKKVAGILGEPTNLEKIEIGHKGNIFIKIKTFGRSGHGSEPLEVRDHAVLKMYKVTEALGKLGKKLAGKYEDPLMGVPTISLTSIRAGEESVPNKFPDTCEAIFDVRTTPNAHSKIFDLIKSEIQVIDDSVIIEHLFSPAEYGLTSNAEDIVKVFKTVTRVNLGSSFGSNDMCFFTHYKIPAVVYGPGNPDTIHKPNEFCEILKLNECIEVYKQVVSEFVNIE